jgi:hypothetical protein
MRICFSANLLQPESLRVRPLHTVHSASDAGLETRWRVPTEPEFVNLARIPGIDSEPGGPIRQPYLFLYRPARLHRLAESIPKLLKGAQA